MIWRKQILKLQDIKRICDMLCIMMCVCALLSQGYVVYGYQEGLSDEQLYGNGQENVLGNKPSSSIQEERSTQKQISTENVKEMKEESSVEQVDVKKEESSTETVEEFADDKDSLKLPDESSTESKIEEINDKKDSTSKRDKEASSEEQLDMEPKIVINGVDNDSFYDKPTDVTIDVICDEMDTVDANATYTDHSGFQKKLVLAAKRSERRCHFDNRFNEEGKYKINVIVKPEKGENPSLQVEKSCAFTIDQTNPSIAVEAIQKTCKKKIKYQKVKECVTDLNLAQVEVFVDGQSIKDQIVSEAGIYELTVKASDQAGNQAEENIDIVLEKDEKPIPMKLNGWFSSAVGVVIFVGSTLVLRERRKSQRKESLHMQEEEK